MDDIDVETKSRSIAMPLVAYEFPCSYLGKPRPIESSLPSALFGELLPPSWMTSKIANSTSPMVSQSISDDGIDHNSPLLSCPRRTIDGISSETILESESSAERLAVAPANALSMEVWFTPPLLAEDTTKLKGQELIPIVSIAEPLASVGESSKLAAGSDDPCDKTQLMIGQRGEFLELVYRDHYEYLPDDGDFMNSESETLSPQYSCRILRLNQWRLGDEVFNNDDGGTADAVKGLHHLVVSWKKSGSVLEIFGDGKSIVSIDLLPDDDKVDINADADFIRYWDPRFRLQVFSESSRWFGKIDPIGFPDETSDAKAVFSGAIHHVALYKEGLDESVVKNLHKIGVEKRKDPFHTFFKAPNTTFQPLQLVASPSFFVTNQEEFDNNTPIRGVAVTQEGSASISVGASQDSNSTTALWDVSVEILTLPRYGDLLYHGETKDPREEGHNNTVQIGDRLLLPEGSLRTKVEYRQLESDYFSIPKQSYHGSSLPIANLPGESFSYRLVATKKENGESIRDDSEEKTFFLGTSESIQQELTIIHKNHPPVFEGLPEEVIQLVGSGARPWAMLGTDVFLNDTLDHDIDRVRLDLWANEGTLTIDLEDTEIGSIAEITDCSTPIPTGLDGEWVCSGKNDRNMTLLATPTDVSRILSNLKYKALNWDRSDSIILRVYDGSGGLCPVEIGHDRNSVVTTMDECYSIDTAVHVPPLSRTGGGPPAGNIWEDHRSWWISLAIFLAIISSTCSCAIGCWKRLRRIKKLNDIAVSDLKRPSVVLASPEGSFPSDLIGITEEDQRRALEDMDQLRIQHKDGSV